MPLPLKTSERQRARSLLNQLTEASMDIREGVDAALIERERLLGRAAQCQSAATDASKQFRTGGCLEAGDQPA